jgi:hypothetical protein
MNRWYRIRRLRGAVFLILVGVLALLNQWNILRWRASWPLFIIVYGVLLLAERAAWTADARAQQEAHEYASFSAAGSSQPLGGAPVGSASWPPASESPSVGSGPFVQSHPPAPEEPGGEGR